MRQKRISEALVQLALTPRNLAKSLNRWLPQTVSQGASVLALDGQWLKLLQVEGLAGVRRITKLLACPVEGKSVEEIAKTFRETCETEGIVPRDLLIGTPTHLSTVRLFSLPSTDLHEIRDIVELQAEKHTPYAKDEVLTDFTVIDRDRAGYSRVLLVIAHKDVIHRSVLLVETLGLTLDRIGCELEGLTAWFELLRKGTAAKTGDATLVVDVDGSTTTLIIMQRRQLLFHRSLAMGVEQLHDDPAHAGERFVSELQRSVEAFEAEGGAAKLHDVIVTGCVERAGALKAPVEAALNLPVQFVSSWGRQELPDALRAACERLPDVSFASLLGLALGPSQINLTPQTTKLRQAFEARAKALILLACQGVAAMVLVSLLIIGRAQKEQRYYTTLRAIYAVSAKESGAVEKALRELEFVKDRLRQHGQLLNAVETMAALSPPGIQWQSMTFTEGETMVLKGTSEELPKIYEFVAGLNSAPLFKQVESRRVSRRKFGEKELTDFELNCPLLTAK